MEEGYHLGFGNRGIETGNKERHRSLITVDVVSHYPMTRDPESGSRPFPCSGNDDLSIPTRPSLLPRISPSQLSNGDNSCR